MSTTKEVTEQVTVEVAKICGCNWESCSAVRTATTDAIDKALQAERERCAKTAETHGDTYLDCDGGRDCWKQIAAAIREGKPQE
jgi:hypothetical protein